MKFIVQLKEPPVRRLLRYALWSILLLSAIALMVNLVTSVARTIREGNMKETAGLLVQFAPQQAISVAEKLYKTEPSTKTRLALIRICIDAKEWDLADAFLEKLRPCSDFKSQAYDVLVTSHVAPEALPSALKNFKAAPQSDEERLLLARVASEAGDESLRSFARRALHQMETNFFKDRASLYLAQMAYNSGDTAQAKDLAIQLIEKKFTPRDSLQLLEICENLKLPEADDYRSTLKVNARSSVPMALALARHFAKSQEPSRVAEWLKSLPTRNNQHPETKLKTAELFYLSGAKEEAIASLQKIGSPALENSLTELIKNQSATISALDSKELVTFVRFSKQLGLYAQELTALNALNKIDSTLWSRNEAVIASERSHNEMGIISAYKSLLQATENCLIIKARESYWNLIASFSEPKESYTTLKEAALLYPERTEIQTTLAFAHYKLGNLTDALLVLPSKSKNTNENLIGSYLLAKAGQYEKAADSFKNISADDLSPAESDLYNQISKLLQSNAPLQRWLELLKQN